MSNLIIDDYPLLVLPNLAKEIGLNEAIILQQIHFWSNKSDNYIDGRKWIYNTYDDWSDQFPFWSKSTIIRTLRKLEKSELLLVSNYNKARFDNTKWYSVNYEKLSPKCKMNRRTSQNE